ncbi:MAG: MOSC domain-containing protein [Bacteroidota bacterium]
MQVTALYRYPVKSLGGQSVDALPPEGRGFRDDRRWMFVEPDGMFISCRAVPSLLRFSAEVHGDELRFIRIADGEVVGAVAGARSGEGRIPVSVWGTHFEATLIDVPNLAQLTETLGLPDARLVYMAPEDVRPVDPRYAKKGEQVSFADGYPYLITNTTSLQDLAARMGETSLDMRRFRPNIVLSGASAWSEDDWQQLQIGTHQFRLPKPCARCIMVTHAPDTGERDLRVLAELNTFRKVGNKVLFGMNACWEGGEGEIAVGDKASLA